MLTHWYQIAILFGAAGIYYIMDWWLVHTYDHDQNCARDWIGDGILAVLGLAALVQLALWPKLGLHFTTRWTLLVQAIGVALILSGYVLIWWARRHIGIFFNEKIALRADHRLVTTGPYAYVRHPVYTGAIISAFGMLLVALSLPMLLLAFWTLGYFCFYAYREETMLTQRLAGYVDYMARVPRFVPNVTRLCRKKLSNWQMQTRRVGLSGVLLWTVADVARFLAGAPIRSVSQITPQLYLGGQYRPRGWPKLAARGITAVVNLRAEYNDEDAGIVPTHYLYLPTDDDQAPTLDQLQEGITFITAEIEQGGGVYVHSNGGVDRAVTMVAAYLRSTGLTAEQAWAQIRRVRPFVCPHQHRSRRSRALK
jgi:protein-S-isoprenylcysteine O-methyltransferase Ste14